MKNIKAILIQYSIATALLLFIIFFVGRWSVEPCCDPWLFFKFPPTTEWYMCMPEGPDSGTPLYEKYLEDNTRYVHYGKLAESQRGLEGVVILLIMQLCLIALVIKPVFSKKAKHILIDVLLFILGCFLSIMTCGIFYNWVHYYGVLHDILFIVALIAVNFMVFRVLRPAKKY